jgi:hypothetical protein
VIDIIQWIDNNGIEAMVVWAAILLIAGTVPPLSPDAGFWAKWGYAILKGFSLNARGIGNALNIKMPELSLEKGVQVPTRKPSEKAADAATEGHQQ